MIQICYVHMTYGSLACIWWDPCAWGPSASSLMRGMIPSWCVLFLTSGILSSDQGKLNTATVFSWFSGAIRSGVKRCSSGIFMNKVQPGYGSCSGEGELDRITASALFCQCLAFRDKGQGNDFTQFPFLTVTPYTMFIFKRWGGEKRFWFSVQGHGSWFQCIHFYKKMCNELKTGYFKNSHLPLGMLLRSEWG